VAVSLRALRCILADMPVWGSWPGRRVLQEAVVESPPKDEGGSEASNLEAMLGSVMLRNVGGRKKRLSLKNDAGSSDRAVQLARERVEKE